MYKLIFAAVMTISYRWLLDYLPQPLAVDELSRILTSIGLEVEAVEKAEAIKGGLEGLLIGEVVSCAPHPNADKLRVTTVSTGGPDVLHIVCGAPNVEAGQRVVVAPVGAHVHPSNGESFEIKRAKIRGELSEGMICAEDEIGLGESHAGIMVLERDAMPGMLAREYFRIPEPDFAIHIGLTPNRSDAASHIGVARDVCAYLSHHGGTPVRAKMPEVLLPAGKHEAPPPVSIQIQAQDGCPRYMGISLSGLQVGPSPEWLKARLQTIGIRSINNLVDITNYVLHEYGQPLHAFDAEKLRGSAINVRFAHEGETFVTLDGRERQLRGEDLMICDGEGPVAMAGIFGGLHSGISESTTRVFIESAYFNPATIRRSSLRHGLRTDAATHFEKGVDIAQLESAMLRAALLMLELAGGQVDGPATDVYPTALTTLPFNVTYEFINRLAGKTYPAESVQNILRALGFGLSHVSETGLTVTVPSSKHDVRQPADIVEEIMRIDGLDEIQIPQRLNISLIPVKPSNRALRNQVADMLSGFGFSEMVTNSITNSRYYPDQTDLVRMLNSLSSELDVMRPSMLETGLEVVSYNLARRNADLLLFEHGNIYTTVPNGYSQLPKLALYAAGQSVAANYRQPAVPADVYFLKSVIQNLVRKSGIRNVQHAVAEDGSLTMKWKNQLLATISAVATQKAQQFDIREAVSYAEIDWALWSQAMEQASVTYQEVARFPAVQRDLAIVLDKAVTYAQVQRATDKLKLGALQGYKLFDVFESDKLGAGKKSLALNYTFQLSDRTLTDAETEAMMKQLTDSYTKDLGAVVRS
jgi:phenylalanyl-tRNA synthetase beta chain